MTRTYCCGEWGEYDHACSLASCVVIFLTLLCETWGDFMRTSVLWFTLWVR